MSLIQKYQPVTIEKCGFDKHFEDIIKLMIRVDNLNLILYGHQECGKSTILKLIITMYYAKEIEDDIDIRENILHINNSTDQGIQYYRNDVKSFCQTCSLIPNKKKIVVLDDLDLINQQSQQVFRNCIDSFNEHVHFLCSCTSIQKIIESIQSRQMIIKMKTVTNEKMYSIFNEIVKDEKIVHEEEAKEFVIKIANKSVRTMISYLEKFKLINEVITLELAHQACTNINFSSFDRYVQHLRCYEDHNSHKLLLELHDMGYSVMDILDAFYAYVKTTTCLSEYEKYKIVPYLCKYIQIFHEIHEDEMELAFFTNNISDIFRNVEKKQDELIHASNKKKRIVSPTIEYHKEQVNTHI